MVDSPDSQALDLRSLSDDDVIEMIGVSKNFDRELLVDCLSFSTGEAGVPFLRSLLEERGRGSVHIRGAALNALANRLGLEATPELTAALHGGTWEIQQAAVDRIQRMDESGQFTPQLFEWLQRRLRNLDRAPFEISGMLLYAHRAGTLLPVLVLLDRYKDNLLSDESKWLEKAWPREDRVEFQRTGAPAHEPDQAVLAEWYRVAATVPPTTPLDLDGPAMADEYTSVAIRRGRRRLKSL